MSFTAAPIKKSDQIPDQVPANQLAPQTGQVAPQTGPVTPPVGAGVMTDGTNGATPPPGGAAADIGTAYASLINVFAPPGAANVDTAVLIAATMSNILESVGKAANRQTETYNAQRQEAYGKKLQEIQAAIDELAKVKDCSLFGKIEVACKAVLGAILIVVGIVANVIPGLGQAGGTLLIWAGAILLASAIEDVWAMKTGHSLLGYSNKLILEKLGVRKDLVEDITNDSDWLNGKALMVAEIVVAYLSFGASSAPSTFVRVLTLVAGLTDATGKAVVTVINKQNDDHRERANRHKASEAELQAVTDQIAAYYQQAIEHLMQSSRSRVDTLQPVFTNLQDRGNVRVRFTPV
jgi:hypothetical protein